MLSRVGEGCASTTRVVFLLLIGRYLKNARDNPRVISNALFHGAKGKAGTCPVTGPDSMHIAFHDLQTCDCCPGWISRADRPR